MKYNGVTVNQMSKGTTLYNIDTLYKARNNVIKFFESYHRIVSEGKFESINGKKTQNINS